ncbi:MAG: O-antigen/teichoic acid export membrane protein [Candidatus Paceibacteria bacterium]|jgi:O-antigen/teichoic acid export membrane protein
MSSAQQGVTTPEQLRSGFQWPGSASTRLTLFDQAIVSGSNFLNTVILVRGLGLALFGEFSMLWLLVVFFVSVEQALLGQPLLTFVPKSEDKTGRGYLSAVLRLAIAFTILVAASTTLGYGVFLSQWDSTSLSGTLVPLVLAVTFKQAHAFVRSGFFSTGRRDRAFWNDLIAYPGQPIVMLVLWKSGHLSIPNALWVIGAFSLVATFIGVLSYEGRSAPPHSLRQTARRHWKFSKWMTVMAVAQWFGSNSYLVAAAALLGASAVGTLKAAQTVIGVLHLLFLAMENVVPVTAARLLTREGKVSMKRYLQRVGKLGLACTASISLVLILLAHSLLGLLYQGEVTPELVLALRGLAAMYLFSFLISLFQIGFRTIESTRIIFLTYMVNTIVAICLAETVVESFGFTGAVCGIIGQQALLATLLGIVWWRQDRVPAAPFPVSDTPGNIPHGMPQQLRRK